MIFISFPRRIVFGARDGIFGWPVVGRLARAIGTVPIYRAEDYGDATDDAVRREANLKSLTAMAEAVAAGDFIALFPEGLSHDDPKPRQLKPGAARLFYQAIRATPPDAPRPVLLPVGLHYDEKQLLGSSVLLVFHPPIELPEGLASPPAPDAPIEQRRARYSALTREIEQTLMKIVHATENWEVHHLLDRARKLVRAERSARSGTELQRPEMSERVLAFSRLWTGYNERMKTHPGDVQRVLQRIARYERALAAVGLEDHELDYEPGDPSRRDLGLALKSLLVFLVLPPVLLIGYLANLPPALIVLGITTWRAKEDKDEATLKILSGAAAFPLAWLIASLIVVFGLTDPATTTSAFVTGLLTFTACAAGGFLTLTYQRFAAQTIRAIRLRTNSADQADALGKLRAERSAICDIVERLAEGLDLPGQVLADGRIADP